MQNDISEMRGSLMQSAFSIIAGNRSYWGLPVTSLNDVSAKNQ